MKFLEAITNVFRVPDLRKRLLFALALLAVYRLGGHIPTPGIDPNKLEEFFQLVGVDAGSGDMPTQAIHRQQSQREQEPLAQVRYAKDIRNGFEELHAC